jgi:prepilin peptidase CpaA
MFEWTIQHIVFIVAVGVFTGAAAVTDTYFWKIPNKLTVPFFAVGWIYQLAFWGGMGFLDGLGGFALGFGTYYLAYFVRGAGGGDVKLMGALSVWLGFKLTLWLMILSTFIIVVDVMVISIYKVLRYGAKKWKAQHLATGKTDARGKPVYKKETLDERRARRILPFAIPLATATWLLMLLNGAGIIKDGQLGPPRIVPEESQAQAQVDP